MLFEAVDEYMALSQRPVELTSDGRYIVPAYLKQLHNSGEITGERFDVVYQIVDSQSGERIWPNAQTASVDLYDHHSREWGIGRFSLYGHTPDNKLLPGYHYRYTLTLDKGSSLATRSSSSPLQCIVE